MKIYLKFVKIKRGNRYVVYQLEFIYIFMYLCMYKMYLYDYDTVS